MMAAMITKTTPENRKVKESFFFKLMLIAQSSCCKLAHREWKWPPKIPKRGSSKTYRQRDGEKIHVGENIRDQDREDVEFGVGRLADCEVSPNLVVENTENLNSLPGSG
jgi:hypothetical protein